MAHDDFEGNLGTQAAVSTGGSGASLSDVYGQACIMISSVLYLHVHPPCMASNVRTVIVLDDGREFNVQVELPCGCFVS